MKKYKYKILFIDDDTFIGEMFEKKFKEAGFDVEVFEDANGDIVQRVLDVEPDLISLDIIMPGRDGWEALEILKADERTKNIPVFIFSNMGQGEDIKKSLSVGAVDHLVMANYSYQEADKIFLSYLKNPTAYKQINYEKKKIIMNEQHKYKNILSIVAVAMLLLAIPSIWPYAYFQVLRWVVMGVAIFNAYLAYHSNIKTWLWIMVVIAVLFNPIMPLYLGKDMWVVIDIITALLFFISIKQIKS
ncbi:DUF6804 family protein [Patescibacteria group bacterium]